MSKSVWSMAAAIIFCGWLTSPLAGPPRRSPPPKRAKKRLLKVVASGFKNDKGYMACLAFRSAKGFPGKPKKAVQAARSRVKRKRGVCVFVGLPPGIYAVSVIHDANDNKKLDTNFLGVPREGYGFSNNAKGTFGPPPFKRAAFRYHRPIQRIYVKMN